MHKVTNYGTDLTTCVPPAEFGIANWRSVGVLGATVGGAAAVIIASSCPCSSRAAVAFNGQTYATMSPEAQTSAWVSRFRNRPEGSTEPRAVRGGGHPSPCGGRPVRRSAPHAPADLGARRGPLDGQPGNDNGVPRRREPPAVLRVSRLPGHAASRAPRVRPPERRRPRRRVARARRIAVPATRRQRVPERRKGDGKRAPRRRSMSNAPARARAAVIEHPRRARARPTPAAVGRSQRPPDARRCSHRATPT